MKLKEPFYVVSIKYPVTPVHVTVQGQTIQNLDPQAPKLIEHLLYARDLGCELILTMLLFG